MKKSGKNEAVAIKNPKELKEYKAILNLTITEHMFCL